jgi:uncharacterized protein YqeY
MLVNEIRNEMVTALKNGDKERKQVYSGILDALTKEAKNLLVDNLTPEQEVQVIKRMLNQNRDSIENCPASRPEILEKLNFERAIIAQYMPQQMNEDEIKVVINEVLAELNITAPTKGDKGKIMKVLMPKVKGKADGKLVNETLMGFLA